jgi:hypothetical protein
MDGLEDENSDNTEGLDTNFVIFLSGTKTITKCSVQITIRHRHVPELLQRRIPE